MAFDGTAPTLTVPQAQYLALEAKYRAFIAGYGSGKTWVGCAGLMQHHYAFPKDVPSGYFAPIYPQIRDIFYPTIEEVAFNWGLKADVREGNKEVHYRRGRWQYGTTICRSMEKPETIVGFKIGKALADELDTLKLEKAQKAWRKIIARMRVRKPGLRNGIDVTTTPEGFRFVHKQWVEEVRKNPQLGALYGRVHASTYDNEANLPDDYIPSLLSTYPANLVEAYIEGMFVNLLHGTVYKNFSRKHNRSREVVEDGEPVHVGTDFNVGKMSAVIHVLRNGVPHAVGEVAKMYDTPDMIRALKERLWLYDERRGEYIKDRTIIVYPDASGGSRRSNNASETDIQLLQQAGFKVDAPKENPPVKDRINSMNAMFLNAKGERRYMVNVDECPIYAACLEQQAYDDNGEPDKKNDLDHHPDAGGYFIHRKFPVYKPRIETVNFRV